MYRYEMARTQREILGLSQKQFADSIGLSQTYISKYEKGDEVRSENVELIHKGLTSIRDRMYPEGSYERCVYSMELHCALFRKSETFNDKIEYLNKIMRDVTYLIQFVMVDKKKSESMARSEAWRRGYR